VGETFDGTTSRYDFSADHTRRSIERSLSALRRTTLDVVCIHSDGRDRQILQSEGVLETLRTLQSEGVIRAIGLSAKSADGVLAAVEHGLDVIMATVNPGYRDELPAIAQAHNAGLGVLVKKAMLSGHGAASGLAFAARQQGVSSVVTGTLNPLHLRENAAAVSSVED
jgi:aryl-alcohol dehydrogenase-like predicted oxidoreductase